MTEIQKRGFPMTLTWEAAKDLYSTWDPRKGHWEITPKTAEWLTTRAEFVERWYELQDEGLRAGFLTEEDGDGCYPTTNTEDRRWINDEEEK